MSVIDFILNLKDRMSGSLDRVSEKSAKTKKNLDDLNKAQEGVDGGAKKAAKSVGDLEEQLRKLKARRKLLPENATKELKDVNREIESLERNIRRTHTIGRTAGRRSGAGGMGLLANPMALVTGALVAGTFKAMESGAQQGHERVKMQNEFGTYQGNQVFGKLRSQRSSLGEGSMESGLSLARSGISNEDLIPTLRKLGDVANGSEAKLSGLSESFAELQKKGTLTRSTLEKLRTDGFDPIREMSRTTGEGFESLFGKLDAGKITIDDVTSALNSATEKGGAFFGNLDRLDESTLSRWTRLKDKISSISANFGENLLRNIGVGGKSEDDDRGYTDLDMKAYQRERARKDEKWYHKIIYAGDNLMAMGGDASKVQPSFMNGGDLGLGTLQKQKLEREQKELDAYNAVKNINKNQDSINRVNGGGQRVYNITVGKLIETMNNTFQGGVKENASEINQIISQELIKLLASSTAR